MFKKELFSNDGPYLRYDNSIVARFKYSGPFTKANFKKFLVNSGLTPDNYFQLRQKDVSPLSVWELHNPISYELTLAKWRAKW